MFFSVVALAVFMLIAAVGLLLSRSARYGYVYADSVLFKNASFVFYVFRLLRPCLCL